MADLPFVVDCGASPRHGCAVWVHDAPLSPVVSVIFSLQHVGSKQERLGECGVADRWEALLHEGAGPHDAIAWARLCQEHRIDFFSQSTEDHLSLGFRTLPSSFEQALRMAEWMLGDLRIDEASLSQVSERLMVDWRQSEEDPDERALRLLQQRVLPVGHPYRHRSYEDCLADADAIDAGVIRGYIRRVAYRTHFTAAASGAVSLPLLLEAVDRIADHWAAAPPQDFLPWETYRMGEGLRGTMAWDPYPLPHTTIAFAGPGVSRMSEDYHAHLVGYSLLGDGPEGARLWDRIRERMGSTYHITAELAPRPHALLSLGQTSTDPAQAERMIEMIMEAYDSMLSDPPTVDQVERCKQRLLGQIALSYGSSLSIVSLLARYQIIGLSLEDLIARTDRLRAVDHGDVVRLLPMTMRSEQLTFAVVGTPA